MNGLNFSSYLLPKVTTDNLVGGPKSISGGGAKEGVGVLGPLTYIVKKGPVCQWEIEAWSLVIFAYITAVILNKYGGNFKHQPADNRILTEQNLVGALCFSTVKWN